MLSAVTCKYAVHMYTGVSLRARNQEIWPAARMILLAWLEHLHTCRGSKFFFKRSSVEFSLPVKTSYPPPEDVNISEIPCNYTVSVTEKYAWWALDNWNGWTCLTCHNYYEVSVPDRWGVLGQKPNKVSYTHTINGTFIN